MDRTKKFLLKIKMLVILLLAIVFMLGCNAQDSNQEADAAGESEQQAEESYDDYIKKSLDEVSRDSSVTPVPSNNIDTGHVIEVTNGDGNQKVQVSAQEALPSDSGVTPSFDDGSASSSSSNEETEESKTDAVEEDDSSSAADEPLTPDDFKVGTSVIYIDGKNDTGYASEIIAAINKARTDLGYEPLIENTGLNKCADRRTREIACYFNHMRPNATPFYSVAPEYFKAEMLAIDNGEASETVDAWIWDPNSRGLLFNTKYTKIGAACFKCNGLNCIVVSYGY